jgi:hypothetical protein
LGKFSYSQCNIVSSESGYIWWCLYPASFLVFILPEAQVREEIFGTVELLKTLGESANIRVKKTVTTKNNGPSDTFVSYRYNLFKSAYYNHFVSLLAEASIPTGDFESKYIARPGLQTGTGDFTFGGGLLYTYRFDDFWLHTMAGYTKIVTSISLVMRPGSGWHCTIPQDTILCSV